MPLFGSPVSRLKKKGDVEGLVELLGDKDARTRAAAREALEEMRDPRAADLLISALENETSAVRSVGTTWARTISEVRAVKRSTVELLASLGGERGVDALIGALRNPDYAVRAAAAEVLGMVGATRAVESLATCVDDRDLEVQKSALQALMMMGDAATAKLWASVGDEDPVARNAAMRALARLGDVQAVERLLALVADTSADNELRSSSAILLGQLRTLGTRAADNPTGLPRELRDLIDDALRSFRTDPALIPYLIWWFGVTLDKAEVVEIGGALAEFGARALEPLLAAVGDVGMRERYRAVAPMRDDEAGLLILELTNRRLQRLESIFRNAGIGDWRG
jgi:HEAT repeat protein